MLACVCETEVGQDVYLRQCYVRRLHCSILVVHFEEFQLQKKLVKLHIPSKYSKEMAQRSQMVSLVYQYI